MNKRRMAFDLDSNLFQAAKLLALKRDVPFAVFMSSIVEYFLKNGVSDDERLFILDLIENKQANN